jgi:hypothetical protein
VTCASVGEVPWTLHEHLRRARLEGWVIVWSVVLVVCYQGFAFRVSRVGLVLWSPYTQTLLDYSRLSDMLPDNMFLSFRIWKQSRSDWGFHWLRERLLLSNQGCQDPLPKTHWIPFGTTSICLSSHPKTQTLKSQLREPF